MSIKQHVGDLLSVTDGIIVHGCNCRGVMGSGVAFSIRQKWPIAYGLYIDRFQKAGLRLGDIIPVAGSDIDVSILGVGGVPWSNEIKGEIIVVNGMTQQFYCTDKNEVYVDYDAISAVFAQVKLLANKTGLPVHFPKIGAGLANGYWNEIKQRIEAALGPNIESNLWILP
jgi:O-acetyl-ADP-ribose deacetylase (regulator of RNase III)